MAKQKSSTAKKVAKGAAGVAATAGVVAGIAAMADKDTRNKVLKGAKNTFDALEDSSKKAAGTIQEGYKSTAHQIRLGDNKKSTKKKKK